MVAASTVDGVGYETSIPPIQTAAPYPPTPFDTTTVATPAQREASLACQESVPLYRTASCDITTWDDCGNLFGDGNNISGWVVSVTNAATGTVSDHVSPIVNMETGVARFYFTALELGVYTVSVQRNDSSSLPSLRTPTPMTVLVVVSNTISKCTAKTVLHTQGKLAETMWAAASFNNEHRSVPGLEGLSRPTSVVVDREWIYPSPTDEVQTTVRRTPLQPRVLTTLEERLPDSDSHYKFCDVIQKS